MISGLIVQILLYLLNLNPAGSSPIKNPTNFSCYGDGQSPSAVKPDVMDCLNLAKSFSDQKEPDAPRMFSEYPVPDVAWVKLPFTHHFGSCYIHILYVDARPPFYDIATWYDIGSIVSDTANKCLAPLFGMGWGAIDVSGNNKWLVVSVTGPWSEPPRVGSNQSYAELTEGGAERQRNISNTGEDGGVFSLSGVATE